MGTSGYGYHEWSPSFYPAELCYRDYLPCYARRLSACELTSTFFEMPSSSAMARLGERVPGSFRFTAKLFRRLTHERETDLRVAASFAEGLRPLSESGKLGAVLAQFPFSFVNHPYTRAYLCRLRAALELPLVVEVRNESWLNAETLDFLRGWGIGLAVIDAPESACPVRPLAVATSEIGYVRFHGRNAGSWWVPHDRRRYRYRYRHRELLSWLPRIREIDRHAKDTFVFFNNYQRAHAVTNALAMTKLLDRARKRSGSTRAHVG